MIVKYGFLILMLFLLTLFTFDKVYENIKLEAKIREIKKWEFSNCESKLENS